jgi:hypothetical protein
MVRIWLVFLYYRTPTPKSAHFSNVNSTTCVCVACFKPMQFSFAFQSDLMLRCAAEMFMKWKTWQEQIDTSCIFLPSTCINCKTNHVNIIFGFCGHLVLCSFCCFAFDSCPVCCRNTDWKAGVFVEGDGNEWPICSMCLENRASQVCAMWACVRLCSLSIYLARSFKWQLILPSVALK